MPLAEYLEICREPLYDYVPILNDDHVTLFSIPYGQRNGHGHTKTYRDTNLYSSGMLESPTKMLVTGIRCCLFRKDGSLVEFPHELYWMGMLRLDINNKNYWESPLADVVDPVTLHHAIEKENLTGGRLRNLEKRFCQQLVSDRIAKNRIAGSKPPDADVSPIDGILIERQENFRVVVECSADKIGGVLCLLDGVRSRAIL